MSIAKIWVVAEVVDGAPTTTSLELVSHARTLADTVEAVVWGDGASAAGTLGEYGATTVHDVGDLGGALPGAPVAAAIAAAVAAGAGPDAVLFPATYDGRDIAGRLSVKLDRPVLTNVVDLTEADGGLVSQHAIFGGAEILTARFTGEGPGIFVIRAKSFAAEPSAAPRRPWWPPRRPTPVRPTRPASWPATSRSAPGPSWTRPTWSSRAAAAWARRSSTS